MPVKLLLIEGLPGTGKSTTAQKIHKYLAQKGMQVRIYNEGDRHPADLSWHACVPADRFDGLLAKYPNEKKSILQQTSFEDGYAVTAYTRVSTENPELFGDFEAYEVYDNRVPFALFRDLHRKRWSRFASRAAEEQVVYIFECAFLQNHVNEMILFQNFTEEAVFEYMASLADTVKQLDPVVIYLSQPDVDQTFRLTGDMRVDADGKKVWLSRCNEYVEKSLFGQVHALHGTEGSVTFFKKRKLIELQLLERLDIKSFVIENAGLDWENVWYQVKGLVDYIMGEETAERG